MDYTKLGFALSQSALNERVIGVNQFQYWSLDPSITAFRTRFFRESRKPQLLHYLC